MTDSDDDHRYAHIAARFFGEPLLLGVNQAEVLGTFLRSRIDGEPQPAASQFIGQQQREPDSGRWKGYRKVGNVGAVSVLGELVNRGAWLGASSGLTSYEGLLQQVRAAGADPEVDTVVLDMDSPGGEAAGMFDAARQLKAAAAGKPVIAVASSHALSAAYGLASAADQIIVNEGGSVGSVGVVMVHLDQSNRLEKAGVKATILRSGTRKAAGLGPLDDESTAALQARVDEIMAGFVKLVTDHRPQLTADQLIALQGDVLMGQAAVDAGLADAVGTFESVVAGLLKSTKRAPGRTTSNGSLQMTEPSGPAASTPAVTTLTQADVDATVAKAVADATAKAAADATAALTAERARMAGLDALAAKSGAGAAEIITKAKADGTSVEATALAIINAGAHLPGAALTALAADDVAAAGAKPAAAGGAGAAAAVPQTKEGWTAEYKGSAKLQAEFASAEDYAGFKAAEARGGLRILKGRDAA